MFRRRAAPSSLSTLSLERSLQPWMHFQHVCSAKTCRFTPSGDDDDKRWTMQVWARD